MSSPRFWVIGGEYRSLEFEEIVDGTQLVLGPFDERDAAESSWRDISERHRSHCTVRFTIAQENSQARTVKS
jgi:hypothetical protein